ncbi:hypothetical protein ASG87_03825 [Frateuria sp. Soil773]|uniref:DUF2285 domain-containing protein n=1 Tax=Frateuria sp. Soil773 TaxID=1736407 RepID=UPI0006FE397C|nr:DUF2285 domain-containing protein [Frateuria sp. Soil773]KRE89471.1 hypothetical protein ASG87_03825 [Frateuria sp. Soil773]
MTGPAPYAWHASAAYLYVLHLDGPALAWEYLRRHPDYRRDWRHHGRTGAVARWGLHMLENPNLDARDAHPVWYPEPAGVVQLHPDLAPAADAMRFDFWSVAGHKRLFHDGRHLALTVWSPGHWQRFALALALEQGMPYVQAVHGGDPALPPLASDPVPWSRSRARPSRGALLETHTLQALDAALAGATLREVAEVLYGPVRVAADWHADSALRAHVRRLAQRGAVLMRGGYRRLLQHAPAVQGRLHGPAERP